MQKRKLRTLWNMGKGKKLGEFLRLGLCEVAERPGSETHLGEDPFLLRGGLQRARHHLDGVFRTVGIGIDLSARLLAPQPTVFAEDKELAHGQLGVARVQAQVVGQVLVVLHVVEAERLAVGHVGDAAVGLRVVGRDELFRNHLVQIPLEALALEVAPQLDPRVQVTDVDRLQVRSVHVENALQTFAPIGFQQCSFFASYTTGFFSHPIYSLNGTHLGSMESANKLFSQLANWHHVVGTMISSRQGFLVVDWLSSSRKRMGGSGTKNGTL